MNFVMFACLWFVLVHQNHAVSTEQLTQSESSDPKENLPSHLPSCLPDGPVMCCQRGKVTFTLNLITELRESGAQTTGTGLVLHSFYLPSAVISLCKAYYDLNRVEDKQKHVMRVRSEHWQACRVSRGSSQSLFTMCFQFLREVTAQTKLMTAHNRLLYCTIAFI